MRLWYTEGRLVEDNEHWSDLPMTVIIHLPPEMETRLLERARAKGQDVSGFVHQLLEKELETPQTVDEALAPFRKQVAESGMTDDELDNFFQEIREEVWQEKHGKAS
jgi:hypothetical protein